MGGRIRFRGRRGDERDEHSCRTVTSGRGFSLVCCCLVGFVDSVTFLCVEIPLCAM